MTEREESACEGRAGYRRRHPSEEHVMTGSDLDKLEADMQRQIDQTRRMPSEPLLSISANNYRTLIEAARKVVVANARIAELEEAVRQFAHAAARQLDAVTALLREAADALGPFANLAEIYAEETLNPGVDMRISVQNDDLRRARACIVKLTEAIK